MDRSFHAMAEMLVGKIFPLPVKGLKLIPIKISPKGASKD